MLRMRLLYLFVTILIPLGGPLEQPFPWCRFSFSLAPSASLLLLLDPAGSDRNPKKKNSSGRAGFPNRVAWIPSPHGTTRQGTATA